MAKPEQPEQVVQPGQVDEVVQPVKLDQVMQPVEPAQPVLPAEAEQPLATESRTLVDRDFHEANERMQHVLQQERDAKRAELLAKAMTRKLVKDVKLAPLAVPSPPASPPASPPPSPERGKKSRQVNSEDFAIDFLKLP